MKVISLWPPMGWCRQLFWLPNVKDRYHSHKRYDYFTLYSTFNESGYTTKVKIWGRDICRKLIFAPNEEGRFKFTVLHSFFSTFLLLKYRKSVNEHSTQYRTLLYFSCAQKYSNKEGYKGKPSTVPKFQTAKSTTAPISGGTRKFVGIWICTVDCTVEGSTIV